MPTARASRLLVAAWLVLAGAGVLAGLLLKAHSGPDLDATRDVVGWRDAAGIDAARVLTTIGGPLVVAPLWALALAGLLLRRAGREALFLALAYPGTALLVNAIKTIVDRPRPRVEALTAVSTSGFPSGHAAGSLALVGALLILLRCARGRLPASLLLGGVALVAAIGFSRVYLGVHSPSDVLAGWLLAGAWLAALRRSFARG